ncbi:MAG TPA: hypothetical protein VF244_10575 [Acidimicrobiales bacterium]
MTTSQSSRRGRAWKAAALVAASVGSILVADGPARGVAHPGLNGLIVCGGTLPTAEAGVVDFEVYTFTETGANRTNITDENPITDYNPVFTPDGKKILYEAESVGQVTDDTFELWTMNPNGSGKQLLLANGKPEDIPRGFHPDGSQFVVQSNLSGNADIWKINSDGTGGTNLTNHAANDGWPKWSPDGTRIIFHSDRTGNLEIWSMDPFGGNLVNLTVNPTISDNTPEWSPDGTKIAYTSALPGGNTEIFVMNADGSNKQNMTNNPGFDSIVTWSPDGTKLIWSRPVVGDTNFSASGANYEVFIMNAADGSGVTRLTNAFDFDGRCDWQRLCTVNSEVGRPAFGTSGDDVICGTPGDDRINGMGGNDIILGFAGNDLLSGDDGNDKLFGGLGHDTILGGPGNDFLSGGPGTDRIAADTGERVDPGAGPDQCVIGNVPGCAPRLS